MNHCCMYSEWNYKKIKGLGGQEKVGCRRTRQKKKKAEPHFKWENLRLGQTGLAAGTNPLATPQVELAHLLKKRHT